MTSRRMETTTRCVCVLLLLYTCMHISMCMYYMYLHIRILCYNTCMQRQRVRWAPGLEQNDPATLRRILGYSGSLARLPLLPGILRCGRSSVRPSPRTAGPIKGGVLLQDDNDSPSSNANDDVVGGSYDEYSCTIPPEGMTALRINIPGPRHQHHR